MAVIAASAGVTRRLRQRNLARGVIPVLMLHRIGGTRQRRLPLSMPVEDFRALVAAASRYYRIAAWEDCLDAVRRGDGQPHLVLTLDDGYSDGFDLAWPILREYGATAHFCLSVDFIGGAQPLWWEEVAWAARREGDGFPLLRSGEASYGLAAEAGIAGLKRLPNAELRRRVAGLHSNTGSRAPLSSALSWDQVRRMASEGAQIAGHSNSHAILPLCTDDELVAEVEFCRRAIEEQLGGSLRGFAYPDGACDRRSIEAVRRAGFAYAFAGGRSLFRPGDSVFAIPRIPVEAAMYSVDGRFSWALFEAEMLGIFDRLLLRRWRR